MSYNLGLLYVGVLNGFGTEATWCEPQVERQIRRSTQSIKQATLRVTNKTKKCATCWRQAELFDECRALTCSSLCFVLP